MARRRNRRRTRRNNNQDDQAPHSPAPEPPVPVDAAFGNDVVYTIIIRSNVSSICRFRSLSHWFNQNLSSEALLADFRRLRVEQPFQTWVVTHYRTRRGDRFGWIRMVHQDNNGGVIVTTHSFPREHTFAITGNNPLVRLNERVYLQNVCKNLFVYRLEDRQQVVALLVFNLTSVRETIRIECADPRFAGESFRAGSNLDSLMIIVDPNTGGRVLQLIEKVNDSIVYFEYRFGGVAWRIREVETVQHLTMAERENPLGMYYPTGFVTFREGDPIILAVDLEAVSLYITARRIPGTNFGFLRCGGPRRFMFITQYVEHPSHDDQWTIQSVSLHSMNAQDRYQFVSEVGADISGELIHVRSRLHMYTVDEDVCLAITTQRHQSSGYFIICYNLLLGMWSTYTSPDFLRNHEAGLSYLTRVCF